jgi:hypothetical protein
MRCAYPSMDYLQEDRIMCPASERNGFQDVLKDIHGRLTYFSSSSFAGDDSETRSLLHSALDSVEQLIQHVARTEESNDSLSKVA